MEMLYVELYHHLIFHKRMDIQSEAMCNILWEGVGVEFEALIAVSIRFMCVRIGTGGRLL